MQKFLPGRHAIESFGNGGFRLGGVSHTGSILILPSGIRACAVSEVAALDDAQAASIISEKSEIDFVLIGTGASMVAIPPTFRAALQGQGIAFEVMSTNAAVRIYNVVIAEERRVAAILMAVENA